MFRATLAAVLLLLTLSVNSFGQNFFWSNLGFGEGAINNDFKFVDSVGSTGEIFLYYSHNEQAIRDGIDLDFSWMDSGIIEFTEAATYEFDIQVVDPIGSRWGDFAGPAQSVTANSVTGFLAVNVVSGTGILPENSLGAPFLDSGYDSSADAFLVGAFYYQIVGTGVTQLRIDSSLIVDEGVNLTNVSINDLVYGVPEPGASVLFSICIVAMVGRRRR